MPHDDIDPEPPFTYECADCGNRIEAERSPGECPKCGGKMENISKSRE